MVNSGVTDDEEWVIQVSRTVITLSDNSIERLPFSLVLGAFDLILSLDFSTIWGHILSFSYNDRNGQISFEEDYAEYPSIPRLP